MRILIVGGYGTIGKAVSAAFSSTHEVIVAGRSKGQVQVDMADEDAVKAMYAGTGKLDAVISCAGETKWSPFANMSAADLMLGLERKTMGQVNLVRLGLPYLNEGGSFTLTTGILGDDPIKHTTGAALANGALHSFVKAASLEMPQGIRINVVSPGLVEDAEERLAHLFPGYRVIPMDEVVRGYQRAVLGSNTGEIIRIY